MKKVLPIVLCISVCFLVGYISQLFQADAIANWYPYLEKPPLTPPNIVFPIAWGILYICMGLSIGLVLISKNEDKETLRELFVIQLMLNLTWSIWFFYLHSPILGFINIILLLAIIIYYTVTAYKNFRVSSLLFVPYMLWICFAGYLNLYIMLNN